MDDLVVSKSVPVITIYGRENCDVCGRFKKHIDELGFKYQFEDFDKVVGDKPEWRTTHQVDVMAAYHAINDAHLPVINIDGRYHTFSSAINHLKELKNG